MMTSSDALDTELLRTAITGLLAHAAAAEAAVLEETGGGASTEHGDAEHWAAAPLVAHNTEFKRQQVHRLEAVLSGTTPRSFAEIDHRSAAYYAACASKPAAEVAAQSREVTVALLAHLRAVADEDLLDPSRHPWLNGRQLSLQIVVRGFWHPLGHLGDYHLDRGRVDAAYALHRAAIVEAERRGVPEAVRGMAYYSLGCAQARAGATADALDALRLAVSLNPDLHANLARDHDLDTLRTTGILETIPAPAR
jgi:tetratricopeptide (TPR) repeat protein